MQQSRNGLIGVICQFFVIYGRDIFDERDL